MQIHVIKKSPCPIIFLHQHNWAPTRRGSWLNVSLSDEILNLTFYFLLDIFVVIYTYSLYILRYLAEGYSAAEPKW